MRRLTSVWIGQPGVTERTTARAKTGVMMNRAALPSMVKTSFVCDKIRDAYVPLVVTSLRKYKYLI